MRRICLFFGIFVFVSGCGLSNSSNLFNQVFESSVYLNNLPAPAKIMSAAVYRIGDSTGQRKERENSLTYSSAVPQDLTGVVERIIKESGWFFPVERQNVDHLLTEQRFLPAVDAENPSKIGIVPALVLFEGGIIGYDTSVQEGSIGFGFFGLIPRHKWSIDAITVYLKAVNARTGVQIADAICIRAVRSDLNQFSGIRYSSYDKLLEAEAGMTRNESVTIAIVDALQDCVTQIVLEGIEKHYWDPADVNWKDDPENWEVFRRYSWSEIEKREKIAKAMKSRIRAHDHKKEQPQ